MRLLDRRVRRRILNRPDWADDTALPVRMAQLMNRSSLRLFDLAVIIILIALIGGTLIRAGQQFRSEVARCRDRPLR
jgi:hypothetical protein